MFDNRWFWLINQLLFIIMIENQATKYIELIIKLINY